MASPDVDRLRRRNTFPGCVWQMVTAPESNDVHGTESVRSASTERTIAGWNAKTSCPFPTDDHAFIARRLPALFLSSA